MGKVISCVIYRKRMMCLFANSVSNFCTAFLTSPPDSRTINKLSQANQSFIPLGQSCHKLLAKRDGKLQRAAESAVFCGLLSISKKLKPGEVS